MKRSKEIYSKGMNVIGENSITKTIHTPTLRPTDNILDIEFMLIYANVIKK